MAPPLPAITWPEAPDLELERRAVDATVRLLTARATQHFADNDFFSMASPVPAREVALLEGELRSLRAARSESGRLFHSFSFGHRDEAWGLAARHLPDLALLLPALFRHGSERLYLVAMRLGSSYADALRRLPQRSAEISFGSPKVHAPSADYVGLEFECNDLVSTF